MAIRQFAAQTFANGGYRCPKRTGHRYKAESHNPDTKQAPFARANSVCPAQPDLAKAEPMQFPQGLLLLHPSRVVRVVL